MKQLWMLVGGNGSGKSTFYEQFLKPKGMPFINADLIARQVFPQDPESNSLKAAKIAEQLRMAKLREGESFCFETVFSHAGKVDFIAQAKALGYQVILVVIHLDNNDLNVARVSQRVIDGGHSVPVDKILSRIPRTLNNVRKAIPLCDQVYVLDNSRLAMPFKQVFSMVDGRLIKPDVTELPQWAAHLLP